MNLDLQWPLDATQSARLLEFCLKHGVDSFTATFVSASEKEGQRMNAVIDRLTSFSIGVHRLQRTMVTSGQSHFAPTESWAFNVSTIPIILEACEGSLSNYQIGLFPEDWVFYRKSEPFFGCVSQEGYAFLRLSDEEFEQFKTLGLLFVVA